MCVHVCVPRVQNGWQDYQMMLIMENQTLYGSATMLQSASAVIYGLIAALMFFILFRTSDHQNPQLVSTLDTLKGVQHDGFDAADGARGLCSTSDVEQ